MMISHVKTTPEKLSTVSLVDGQKITVIDSETGINKEYVDFYDEEKDEIVRNLLTPDMECITIPTKQEWDSMSTAEKTDPTKVYFLPWKTASGGTVSAGVTSFNGRNGSVLPTAGDYDATQINYDSNTTVKQKIDSIDVGVISFNGRSGSILPMAGDYTANDITYGQSTVKDTLDNIGSSVVASFNGRNGSVLPVSGDYTANQIQLSSTMSIGGASKTNTEDALTALNNSKVECVTIETEQEWTNMSAAEKNDPTKVYFLPWDTSGSGGGSGSGLDVETDNLQDKDNLIYSSELSAWTNSSNPIFPPPLVSWSTGTDEQITKMIQAYYNGIVTLSDIQSVWSIGDIREVDLPAITTSGTYNDNTWSVGESHRAQTVQLQILDFNHDNLTTSINEITKALITVDQKNCLRDASVYDTAGSSNTEHGYMENSNTNVNGWTNCARRKWCNGGYYQALPEYLRLLIKPVNKLTSAGNQSATINTDSDYVFLLSEIEIFGSVTNSKSGEGSQYAWYANSTTNRNKLPAWSSSSVSDVWWERSPYESSTAGFCAVDNNGGAYGNNASFARGLAPAFCL